MKATNTSISLMLMRIAKILLAVRINGNSRMKKPPVGGWCLLVLVDFWAVVGCCDFPCRGLASVPTTRFAHTQFLGLPPAPEANQPCTLDQAVIVCDPGNTSFGGSASLSRGGNLILESDHIQDRS
jgi:hypothetical protein